MLDHEEDAQRRADWARVNLEAAKTCSHKKKPPKAWATSIAKMEACVNALKKKLENKAQETRKAETKRR